MPTKLLLPIAAVVAVGAATAGGATYLLTRDESVEEVPPAVQATVTPSPTASETPVATATPTAEPAPPEDWVTYTDTTYGYAFDYPATWHLYPEKLDPGYVTLYSYDLESVAPEDAGKPVPADKLKVFFWVADNVDKPLDEWLEEGRNSPGQITPPTVLSQDASLLGGKEGLVELVDHDGIKHISYYIPLRDGRVFVVNAVPADSQVWPQFEPVLDSVSFAP